jgi:hypothetical protein
MREEPKKDVEKSSEGRREIDWHSEKAIRRRQERARYLASLPPTSYSEMIERGLNYYVDNGGSG